MCVATAGVPTRMLRNLGILKMLFLRPTRSDQYKAPPGELRRTATATSKTGTSKMNEANKANSKSNARFTQIPFCSFLETFSDGKGRRPPQHIAGLRNVDLQGPAQAVRHLGLAHQLGAKRQE